MAMAAHCMSIIIKATKFLNPPQTPVVVCDQPLFRLCKMLQWLQPETFGEGKVFILFGGLHIEQAALRVLGEWVDGCGWTEMLVKAGITTPGRADSMVSVSMITRTRYAHEVTAAVLHHLKRKAYEEYDGDNPLTYEEWCEQRRSFPQFRFWDITLKLELIVLRIVRAVRTGNVDLYIEALTQILPYFFALDRQNYERWIPVHVRDLLNLKDSNDDLWQHFKAGYFVAAKSGRLFSKIALDQAHEQVNAVLKGTGGMIGLTENPSALLKWMLSCPEITDITQKFDQNILKVEDDLSSNHHSDTECARNLFRRDKSALEYAFEESGNPFAEDGQELFNIDSRRCCPEVVKTTVMTIEQLGSEQYEEFVRERLHFASTPIHAPIKKNSFPTFTFSPKVKKAGKERVQIQALKSEANHFSRMCVAISNNRPHALAEFFNYEDQEYPPALFSHDGNNRSGNKASLMNKVLAPLAHTTQQTAPTVDALILDGGAIIHLLQPSTVCLLFSDYIKRVFEPFIRAESRPVRRLDVVWDTYRDNSLKATTREKRGDGDKIKVQVDTKIPVKSKWMKFLRNPDNKNELFRLLADSVQAMDDNGKLIYSTRQEEVVSSNNRGDINFLSPCNHEEADTRIFVHVIDAVRKGHSRIMIRASDTDILVLAVYCVSQNPEIKELWIHVKAGDARRYIPAHEIAETLGPRLSSVLPAFHALTGCDYVSFFYGIGKVTAWDALKLQPEAVDALSEMMRGNVDAKVDAALQKFVIGLYSPGKSYESVARCRQALYTGSKKPMDSIPSSSDALKLHFNRASYCALVWSQILTPEQTLPSPADWGWIITENGWEPVRRTLPIVKDACPVISCSCQIRCTGNCSCKKSNQLNKCIPDLCKCVCFNGRVLVRFLPAM